MGPHGAKSLDRVGCDGDVLVVVEIVAPGSRRLDHVTKRPGYADSGVFTTTVPFPAQLQLEPRR